VGAASQGGVHRAVLLGAGFGTLTSLAQRRLSIAIGALRRRALTVDGEIAWRDRTRSRLNAVEITRPAEAALMSMAGAHVLLAAGRVVAAV
jgi:hypothetical protein